MANVLAGGRLYEGADVEVTILGIQFKGIKEVSYTVNQSKENVFALGEEPHGRVRGQRNYEGSVTFYKDEIVKIEAAMLAAGMSPDITKLSPFVMVVTYQNAEKIIQTDVLQNCEFMSKQNTIATGALENACNIIYAGIKTVFN